MRQAQWRGVKEIFEGALILVLGFALWDYTRSPLGGVPVTAAGFICVIIGTYRLWGDWRSSERSSGRLH